MLRQLIFFVIFVSLGILGYHCTEDFKTQLTCPKLQSMLTAMQKQLNNSKLVCKVNGILCSSFSCELSENKTEKYQINGSWQCQNSAPAFEFDVSYNESRKRVILDNSNRSNNLSVNGLTITPSILFVNSTFHFNLTLKNKTDLVYRIQTMTNIAMNCKCSNIKSLQTQVQSKFNVTSINCWGTDSSCSRYYCAGYIHKPELIHFSFKGIGYCDQVKKTPVYNLTIVAYHTKSITSGSRSFYFSKSNEEDKTTFQMEGKQELSLTLNYSYITTESGFTSTLIVSSAIKSTDNSQVIKQLSSSINISFNDSNCQIISTTKPATSTTAAKPKTTQTTTKKSTTVSTTTTTSKITTTSTTATTTKKSTATTTKKPTTSTSTSSTVASFREDNSKASHPAKAVLIILSVVIILTVFFIGIYLKKRKKLSNQPAYYNDIALNDPLRYELEDEEQDDDDELPLFT